METQPIVLIVEDEVLIAFELETELADAGAIPIVCHSLACAERALSELTCQAAVIDLSLPDGDAAQLAERLTAQGIRVVVYSGLSVAPPEGCMLLSKPVRPGTVAATLLGRAEAVLAPD